MVATPSFLYKLTTARSKRENTDKADAQEPPEEVKPDVTKAEFWEDGSLEANLEEDSHGFEKAAHSTPFLPCPFSPSLPPSNAIAYLMSALVWWISANSCCSAIKACLLISEFFVFFQNASFLLW